MPDHYDKPSGLPSFTPVGSYEGIVPFSGVFDAILQNSAQRALMETEGMYTAAEAAFEAAQRDLRDIQMTVPQEQQAEKLAEYLRRTGYSSDIVTQTLGIPKAEVNAALMAGGFDATGKALPEFNLTDTTIPESTVSTNTLNTDQTDVNMMGETEEPEEPSLIDLAIGGDQNAQFEVLRNANEKGFNVDDLSKMVGRENARENDKDFFSELITILMGMTDNADAIGILGRSNLPQNNAGNNQGNNQGDNTGDVDGSGDNGNNNQSDSGNKNGVNNNTVGSGTETGATTGSGNNTNSGSGGMAMPDVSPEGDVVIDDQPKNPDPVVSLPQRPAQTGLLAMVTTPQIVPAVMSEPSKLFEPMSFEMNNVSQYSGLIRRLLA